MPAGQEPNQIVHPFLIHNIVSSSLIVPALSNFKACAENVGSKNRTKMVVFVPKQKSTVCTSTTGADDTTPPIPVTEAIKTEADDSSKVGLLDLLPCFNPSLVRDHFGWSCSWPAGTSPPPPAPPPPLLLLQATNNQLFLNLDQGQDLSQLNHHLRQQGSLGGGGEEKVGRVTQL